MGTNNPISTYITTHYSKKGDIDEPGKGKVIPTGEAQKAWR